MSMSITRDIVTDLLPLYAAGEVSADSRAAVEAMLREDAGLRRLAEAFASGGSLPAASEPAPARAALSRTKALLRRRASLLGAACFFSAVPFDFAFDSHGLRFFALRDAPAVGIASVAAAVFFWTRFAILTRKLKVSGL